MDDANESNKSVRFIFKRKNFNILQVAEYV
jgi:hypothetical protein